jgi:Tfp pilus assembly PilM family ATPase
LARFLALDWDHQQLQVVAATVGRGGVRIQQALVFQEQQSPNPAEGEALGRLLRDRLKEAGIAPAPVLACVGRDRVILKEVRYPAVPPTEEPALVRFQTVKELTDPPDEVVIDFVPGGEVAPGAEQRSLALVVRRELLAAYQSLCRAGGLKLLALTPRPFGTLACLKHVAGTTVLTPLPEPADATVAVLTVAEHWAEFCIARGGRLVLARSLAPGSTLAGEVRRNLVVHAGQSSQDPVRAVYVAGSGEQGALRERLQDLLQVPVHALDPFAGAEGPDLPAADRGTFAAAVGLLHAYGEKRQLPINFVQPKQPKPPADANKRRLLAAAAAVAVLLVGGVSVCYSKLADRSRQMESLFQQKSDLERQLKLLEQDTNRIKAIEDWTQSGIVWLDELYDLTDRFPDTNLIRLTQFMGDPLAHAGKDKHTARMSLKGIMTYDNRSVLSLMAELDKEAHYRVEPKKVEPNRGQDTARFRLQFSTRVDVEKRPPDQYLRQLPPPAEEGTHRSRSRRAGRGGNGPFMPERGQP